MNAPSTKGLFQVLPLAAAAFVMSIAPAMAAAPKAVTKLNQKFFGHGVSLTATSQGAVVTSPQYSYTLAGTCEGTEDLAKIVKKGTSFAVLLDSFSKGISAGLTGVVPPPVAPSKSSIIQLPVKGSRNIKGVGVVTLSALVRCEVPPSGIVKFEIKNVQIKSAAGPLKGVIKMGLGSTLTVAAPPRVICKVSSVTVDEDAGEVKVVISRTISLSGKVTVNYATVDGNAKPGVDYTAVTGSVVFAPNQTEKTVTIKILDNPEATRDRWFRLRLTGISSDPQGAYIGIKPQTNVTIKKKI